VESLVIKLGGSVITYKDKPFQTRIHDINRISKEIAEFVNDYNLVIVHGGGSFGHYVAKKYGIHMGLPKIKLGLSILEKEMRRLNLIIAESMINHGVPVIPISPSSIMITKNKNIQAFYYNAILEAIKRDYVPLIYGDFVFDEDLGCSIISGDQLSLEIAKIIGAKRIIFCIGVTGVYNKDPKKYNDAKLIRNLDYKEIPNLIKNFSAAEDVTGGLANKLLVAYEAAKVGIQSIFINGLQHNLIKRVVRNEEFIGTIIF
jgi:isopentenyl phosphate kinase